MPPWHRLPIVPGAHPLAHGPSGAPCRVPGWTDGHCSRAVAPELSPILSIPQGGVRRKRGCRKNHLGCETPGDGGSSRVWINGWLYSLWRVAPVPLPPAAGGDPCPGSGWLQQGAGLCMAGHREQWWGQPSLGVSPGTCWTLKVPSGCQHMDLVTPWVLSPRSHPHVPQGPPGP